MKISPSHFSTTIRRTFGSLALVAGLMFSPSTISSDPSLMVYDFNLGPVPASNIDFVRSLGYDGLVTRCSIPSDIVKLTAYASAADLVKDFEVLAYVNYDFNNPASPQVWLDALPILSALDAPLWVIVKNAPSLQDVDDLLLTMARRSQLAGVPMVLYPHWDTDIENAAEAAARIAQLRHPNLHNSLHTCHEIRSGNQYNMGAVVGAHVAQARLVTIAGAEDNAYAGPPPPGPSDWKDAIQPLDLGSYDLTPFLRALDTAGYDGPVILQTYGITDDPRHLQRALERYLEYCDNL